MARIFRRRSIASLVTQTFLPADTSFTIPTGVTNLISVSGKGAMGTTTQGDPYYSIYKEVTVDYDPGYGTDTHTGPSYIGRVYNQSAPDDYCDTTYSSVDHKRTTTCYTHFNRSGTITNTTGASATGFDKTFPGSVGATAVTTTSFNDVPATPGAVKTLSIPTGGSITITYLTP